MKAAALKRIVAGAAREAGFEVKDDEQVELTEDDLGLPVVDLLVDGEGDDETVARMHKMQLALWRLLRDPHVRFGLYYREIGFPKVPEGKVLVEMDCFNFDLD